MSWLDQLKFSIKIRRDLASKSATNNYHGLYLDANTLDRIIAIVEGAEWGSILCDDIPDPQCPICGGSKESGHGLVYETKRPCPYSDEWVKS